MPRALLVLLAASLAAGSGCHVARPSVVDEDAPAALFAWRKSGPADSPRPEVPDDPDGDGGGNEAERKAEEPLTTERPDFTNSSRTVGKGRVQLESGYTFTADRGGGGRVTSHSFPEALLRVGMLEEWFEFQVGQNFLSNRTAEPDGPGRAVGPQDLYLAIKFALTPQAGPLPETAVTLQATTPTGSRDQTAGRVLPGLLYLYSWDVVPDRVSLAGSSVATGAADDDGGTYLQLAQSLSVGYTLTDRLGAYTECYALFPSGASAAGVGPQYYFNGGFLYRVTPDFQLDVRSGLGLNRHADDFFTGLGFAVRF